MPQGEPLDVSELGEPFLRQTKSICYVGKDLQLPPLGNLANFGPIKSRADNLVIQRQWLSRGRDMILHLEVDSPSLANYPLDLTCYPPEIINV